MHLSATAIKDWLECPQRLEYRLKGKESKPNIFLIRGLVVHSIIETVADFETAKEKFVVDFLHEINNNDIDLLDRLDINTVIKQSNKMLYNYYNVFNISEPPVLESELSFKVKIKDLEFVGRIDQIRGKSVYDWKTTTSKIDPITLNTDYQFTLYGMAYKELYGEYPENIYYGHLYNGKLYKVIRISKDYNYLESVAEQIIFASQNNIFPRAYGKYVCGYCPYKYLCFDEDYKVKY